MLGTDSGARRQYSKRLGRYRAGVVALTVALVVAACGGAATDDPGDVTTTAPATPTTAGDTTQTTTPATPAPDVGEVLEVVVINTYMGNVWRQVMMRTAELMGQEGPVADRVNVRLVVSEDSAEGQSNAIASVLNDPPDILLLNAGYPTASNDLVEEACDLGVVVVSFDVLVTAPCAWKISHTDFVEAGRVMAEWMVDQVGTEGTIFVDEGIAGALAASDFQEGAQSVLSQYPDLQQVTYFGEFNAGAEGAAVASLLAAHPDVIGVLSFTSGEEVHSVLERAGRDPVPVTGFAYFSALQACVEYDAPCFEKGAPAYVVGDALLLALEVIDGERSGIPGDDLVVTDAPYIMRPYSEAAAPEGIVVVDMDELVEEGEAADVPGDIIVPVQPPWYTFDIEDLFEAPNIG